MKRLNASGRKIPFDNVVRNLKMNKYTIYGADYANAGISLFMENKFADNLGVSKDFLYKIGLLKKGDQNGWNLTIIPDCEKLIQLKNKITRQRSM